LKPIRPKSSCRFMTSTSAIIRDKWCCGRSWRALGRREVFEDTRHAVDAILKAFGMGIAALSGGCCKASASRRCYSPHQSRSYSRGATRPSRCLLRNMVALRALDLSSSNASIDVAALASVISTEEDTQEIDGHRSRSLSANRSAATQSKVLHRQRAGRPPDRRPGQAVSQTSSVRASGH